MRNEDLKVKPSFKMKRGKFQERFCSINTRSTFDWTPSKLQKSASLSHLRILMYKMSSPIKFVLKVRGSEIWIKYKTCKSCGFENSNNFGKGWKIYVFSWVLLLNIQTRGKEQNWLPNYLLSTFDFFQHLTYEYSQMLPENKMSLSLKVLHWHVKTEADPLSDQWSRKKQITESFSSQMQPARQGV